MIPSATATNHIIETICLSEFSRRCKQVDTFFDPRFEYPDLVAVAEGMVAGTISTEAACALARKTTAGEVRMTSVGKALVTGPHAGADKALADLQAYANAHGQSSVERWAAFALMIEAQLGIGDLDPDAAVLGLSGALRGFEPCVRATHAQCPPGAVEFALHTVDSILENSACTDPNLRKRLKAARASFSACEGGTTGGLSGWFKSKFGSR